jgi:enediyne biosynthesis protein E4
MGMSTGARRWSPLLLAAVVGGLLWCGWRWWEYRRHRQSIAEIEDELDNGLHAVAARKLAALLTRLPDSDQANYLLGTCEMTRGRTEAADKAWARVPPDSPLAARAILGRMQLRAERGQFAETEQIIQSALDDSRIDGSSLPLSLGPVWCLQGRLEETLRLIEARWEALKRAGQGDSEPAINLVWGHIELRRNPIPVEMVRANLDQAARSYPQDDRIWLGRANLAMRMGSYAEAAQWLDACLGRRPLDVPVWRARLDYAMATNHVPEAWEALKHLAAADSTAANVHKLAAWFAARRGDAESERRALDRLIAIDPTDLSARNRLADIAMLDGRPDRTADLSRQRSEIEKLMTRYQHLYARHQPRRDSAEMAHLAEQLGYRFEARGFLTWAVGVEPDRDDLRLDLARLSQCSETVGRSGQTVADLLTQYPVVDEDASADLTTRPLNP